MPPDGGLYAPTRLPPLPRRVFDPAPLSYAELASLVLAPFFPDWDKSALDGILEKAYGRGAAGAKAPYFDCPEVAPLVLLPMPGEGSGQALYLLELFHGRTCAFKDLALSVLGGLLRESLDRLGREESILVLTATSGDTGSAALEGLSGVEGIHTAVFYPSGGTSEIQRLQMTTVSAERRFVAGVAGNFDEAQGAVKRIFERAARGEGPLAGALATGSRVGPSARPRLSSANSINIGRLLPQIVYYVAAWRDLAARGALGPGDLMHVAVPTGNFGDILAARYAKEMGLPIGRLICASNANKVLADFFETGIYDRRRELLKTESPSMDILVSSNLERLLYMASGGDGARVASLMGELASRGFFEIDAKEKAYIADFSSGWCSDRTAASAITRLWETCGALVDPHTATAVEVALRAAAGLDPLTPIVVAATASPFKFPRVCLEALGDAVDGGSDAVADAAAAGRGDLELAARLSALTGIAMPGPIGILAGKRVIHDRGLAVGDAEEALAAYARERMGARG
jgi:threonine synthase